MSLSQRDALSALNDVDAADARARAAQANRAGAPYLLIWGAAWVVGYVLTGVLPMRLIGPAWWSLSAVGIVAMLLLPRRTGVKGRGVTMTVIGLSVWAFIAATFWIMQPTTGVQLAVYPPLVLSLIYVLMGSVRRTRIMWVGAAVFVLTLIGYAFLKPLLPFWLAVVGGGGLILGGLWMRQP